MGKEFTVIKELATITATETELVAIDRVIKAEIASPAFREDYVSLITDIFNTYQGFITILEPLTQILAREGFDDFFDKVQPWFADSFQAVHSNARVNAEFTYEKYLQFRKVKEMNTGYPPLKNAFSRLHDLIDKWIDNDIWLALSIDTVLKMLNQIFAEVAKIKATDHDEAYSYYCSCVSGIVAYVDMLKAHTATLSSSLGLDELKQAV